MCGFCDIINKEEPPLDLFSDEDIERVLFSIYTGVITVRSLDLNTYLKIARKLSEGIYEGYGKNISEVVFYDEEYIMLKSLRENVFHFSAAKTYQQTREMSSLLTDKNGIKAFDEFKKSAKEIFDKYNENYLRAEYNSAIAQSNTAQKWQEIQKFSKTLPMLTYHTVGDGRVRPAHEELNNISRPVNDKFWDKFMPPNGWNCRCTVLQSSDAEKTSLKDFKTPSDVPSIFQFNAGKTKMVFSPKHPYFTEVPKKDKPFAKNNFGLPIV